MVGSPIEFSSILLTTYVDVDSSPEEDERILALATEQAIELGRHGIYPWSTEHHFRGAWQSSPIQFMTHVASQLPPGTYVGFGVLSVPFYHPVRLVEEMNLLDQLTKGHTVFGLGSGFPGDVDVAALGLDPERHAAGRAARETIEVMERLWTFETGDEPFEFDMDLAEQWQTYRRALAAAGHPQAVVAECLRWSTADWLSVLVADTDEQAEAAAAEAKSERLAERERFFQKYRRGILGPVAGVLTSDAFRSGADLSHTIAGSPDTVAAEVQRLVDLGVNHLIVRFLGEWLGKTRGLLERSLELFAEEVAPRFADIPPLTGPLVVEAGAARS